MATAHVSQWPNPPFSDSTRAGNMTDCNREDGVCGEFLVGLCCSAQVCRVGAVGVAAMRLAEVDRGADRAEEDAADPAGHRRGAAVDQRRTVQVRNADCCERRAVCRRLRRGSRSAIGGSGCATEHSAERADHSSPFRPQPGFWQPDLQRVDLRFEYARSTPMAHPRSARW